MKKKLTEEEKRKRKNALAKKYYQANKKAIAIKRGSCYEGLELYQGISYFKGFYKPRIFVDEQLILLGKYESETRAKNMYKHALQYKNLYEGSVSEFKRQLSFKTI
jgi:hypothetical protein|tara:strand:- start:665 stop:982 length:318 start_codon:yes stop_codon:yes gene_type:complete